jgi:Secretion system C-terminal sorting domain
LEWLDFFISKRYYQFSSHAINNKANIRSGLVGGRKISIIENLSIMKISTFSKLILLFFSISTSHLFGQNCPVSIMEGYSKFTDCATSTTINILLDRCDPPVSNLGVRSLIQLQRNGANIGSFITYSGTSGVVQLQISGIGFFNYRAVVTRQYLSASTQLWSGYSIDFTPTKEIGLYGSNISNFTINTKATSPTTPVTIYSCQGISMEYPMSGITSNLEYKLDIKNSNAAGALLTNAYTSSWITGVPPATVNLKTLPTGTSGSTNWFTQPGYYVVSLSILNACGMHSIVKKSALIHINPNAPTANFTFVDPNGNDKFDINQNVSINISGAQNYESWFLAIFEKDLLTGAETNYWSTGPLTGTGTATGWRARLTTNVIDLNSLVGSHFSSTGNKFKNNTSDHKKYVVQFAVASPCVPWTVVEKEFQVCAGCRITEGAEATNTQFSLYPNPTNNTFRLQNFEASPESQYLLTLTDITGKTVKTLQQVNQEDVDVSDLVDGLYFVTLYKDGERVHTSKLSVLK